MGIMRYLLLPVLCVGWIVGVAAGSLMVLPEQGVSVALALTTIVYTLTTFRVHQDVRTLVVRLALLGMIAAGFGVWRANEAERADAVAGSAWQPVLNQTVELRGNIQEAEERGTSVRLTVGEVRKGEQPLPGFLRATVPLMSGLRSGAMVILRGRLEHPTAFTERLDQKPRGDLARVFRRHQVFGVLRFPAVAMEGQGSVSRLVRLRESLRSVILRSLPEPAAGLYSAFLLSYDQDLLPALRDQAAATGILHLVAISGTHISAVAAIVIGMALLLGASRRVAIVTSIILATGYIALVGFPESGVRSAVMALLVGGAWLLGREAAAQRGLLLAVTAMTVVNPRLLLGDVGFQLSALAVWGLAALFPRLQVLLRAVPDPFRLRSVIALTLAAEIATLPVVAYAFGRVPLVGPLTNILAGGLFPVLLWAGACVLLVGGALPHALVVVVPLASGAARVFLGITDVAVRIPWHAVPVPPISLLTFLGSVVLLVIAVHSLPAKVRRVALAT